MNKLNTVYIRNRNLFYIFTIITALLFSAFVIYLYKESKNSIITDKQAINSSQESTNYMSNLASTEKQYTNIDKELIYIIEEEKLAHDVYSYLYDKWGAKVFNNIKSSEVNHQNMVSELISKLNLTNPLKDEAGSFSNPELQNLYNELILQGSVSLNEAYKVGVLIEQKDIADLREIINKTDSNNNEIVSVLNKLVSGSENHLKAFNRQVSA